MTAFERPHIVALGATSLLARFGDRIERDLSLRIARLVEHLDAQGIPGLIDLVPAYTTLLVQLDPVTTRGDEIAELVESTWSALDDGPGSDDQHARTIEIPVVYGGDAGPDLDAVAGATGLTPDEVIRRHSDADYTVGALGFSPGFAFLIGLPPELAVPRRATPRTRVPAGSVGIGGAQTGIYSLPTPGGWSLIGRTPRTMFDPERDADDMLRLGDRVRFHPIDRDAAPEFPEPAVAAQLAESDQGVIEIVEAGVQTSVQDLGRPGQGRLGITPGGAVDRGALIAGNRLLGNPDGAAALEWTLLPPAIRFREPCRVVATGADPGWRLDGRPVAIGEVVTVAAGDVLQARPAAGMLGARGYLCVAGGIDVPVVRGSRALDLAAGFGGGFGRPLRPGDLLRVHPTEDSPESDKLVVTDTGGPRDPSLERFRVVRGPQADRFGAEAWQTFLSSTFTVDAQSNRMGLRLNGPAILQDDGADVISEGLVTGTIQVTGSGQPIVLMPGRATIGGYTRIATVIEADHDRLGQLRPGATIRFTEVSVEEARAAVLGMVPSVYGGLHGERGSGASDMTDRPNPTPHEDETWTPNGVIRVIRELATHDIRSFSLRVQAVGLEISIDRGDVPSRNAGPMTAPAPDTGDHLRVDTGDQHTDSEQPDTTGAVFAPLLGTFWRRPSPEAPPFVEAGDRIETGQTVGLIEVMKTFHDVTAPQAGVIRRVLVDDGATVEYGQVLMELEPAP